MGFLDLVTSMTMTDLETPKKGFSEMFAIWGHSAHFKCELWQNGCR